MSRYVINPGGGPFTIPDVQAFLEESRADGLEPYVDLGGGMVVRFADHVAEARDAAVAREEE